MKRYEIILSNSYHNRSIRLYVPDSGDISVAQAKRARRALCPNWQSCQCGTGPMRTMGPDNPTILLQMSADHPYRVIL